MPDDTPIFDALAERYASPNGHDTIGGTDSEPYYFYAPGTFPFPHTGAIVYARLPADKLDAFRDANPVVPVYEYPERPADVPSYTVGHAHSYPYVTRDGRRKAVSITGDEHAVLRVEPFWSE